jgi:beta-N-acetylhexosaminidase
MTINRLMKGFYWCFSFVFVICIFRFQVAGQKSRPTFLDEYRAEWVDSVFQTLSLDQKIGQLLLPRGNYAGQPYEVAKLKDWVEKYHIGGLVFFASTPIAQVRMTNLLQSSAKVPLLIGQDFEWGLGMRLDSTDRFPYAVAQGAIQGNTELMEAMGREVARQCKRLGVHVNYAPVVDVNNNPSNPVINFRSYGSDKQKVAEKGLAYMKGMQSGGILCTAKHFPGHGDTGVDSHYDLPVISHPEDRLQTVELFPFKTLIDNGLSGIMTAHLEIPAFEPQKGLASTFSENIVMSLLRKDLGFEGLTFTDAMDMQGAVKNFPKGEAMVRALLAGNDVLETFMDVPGAVAAIKEAVVKGRIPLELLDQKVRKILKAKSWVGLDHYQPIKEEHLLEDLNSITSDVIHHQMTEKSITCLRNDGTLPFQDLTRSFAVLSLESAGESEFSSMVKQYVPADFYHLPKECTDSLANSILGQLKRYDHVIAGIHLTDIRASKKYGLNPVNTGIVSRLAAMENVTLCLMGNPFILGKIPALAQSKNLILAYQQNKYTEKIVPQVLFGAIPSEGRLPVIINDTFPLGSGLGLPALNRLSYGPPELVGIDRTALYKGIDSIMNDAIRQKAFPGGVVQTAVKGRVIFQKSYGFHTYEQVKSMITYTDSLQTIEFQGLDDAMDNPEDYTTTLLKRVRPEKLLGQTEVKDLFDLASVTKISTSTLAVMQLVSEGKMSLDAPLSVYYPPFAGTNKSNLKMRSLLTHTAGLQAWIPFWKNAIDMQTTFSRAIVQNPLLAQECVYVIKKPGILRRLFGAKPVREIDVEATMSQNPDLWIRLVTPGSLKWKKNTFYPVKTVKFPVRVAEGIYLHKNYKQTIMKQIADSPLKEDQGYVYSDLHYYLYPEIVERLTGKTFQDYLNHTYHSLGAYSLMYNPVLTVDRARIVPTEYDSLFRQALIHGFVHDEGAAMLGGISGHAGLFGNANDLTKLMQMYLKLGNYGNKQYIREEVLKMCTSYQFPDLKIRRGIGFDKKDFDPQVVNAPVFSSQEGFGHSGFTGTFTWADPAYELVYVVLTNRVYPTRNNSKISTLSVRPAIGDHIIRCIKK